MNDFSPQLVSFIRSIYHTNDFIPLHAPSFDNKEKSLLIDAIDSTYVSTVGEYVTKFENKVAEFVGTKYAVATVNGTSALHMSLLSAGVSKDDEVITQSLTFVGTCNAINYCGANPVFLDVDRFTMGMSAESLFEFLDASTEIREDGFCWNKKTNKIIKACVPMHCLGHPSEIDKILQLCLSNNIKLVEDSAESLGSFYKGKHTGSFGHSSILSFNGNKIITSGGGGMVVTNDEKVASQIKHRTTTAKKKHEWMLSHDEVGYNYRMPNINAALGVAQFEKLEGYILNKRALALIYKDWFSNFTDKNIFLEPTNCSSNYWFNSFLAENKKERDSILEYTNSNKVMTRPLWTPMHKLTMFQSCERSDMKNTNYFYNHLVCIPSSIRL
jgi:perosamine synthetase